MNRRAFIFAVALGMPALLAGCSLKSPADQEATTLTLDDKTSSTEDDSASHDYSNDKPFASLSKISGLTNLQRNSLNMLNYIAVLMQQINNSTESRLLLEDIYSNLINNTAPDAVDQETLGQINYMLDILAGYQMLAVKRERLRTIYAQSQANATKQALPNPLGLLSATSSGSALQALASVVYMAVDAANSYSSTMDSAETEYLQSGWELDDEEMTKLNKSRLSMFDYTVDIVSEYGLPGSLTLTEDTVDQLVSWQNEQVVNRIRFLERESDTYCATGAYWLLLAQSYYEQGDMDRCIWAVEAYENLSTGILRKDHAYAKVLALALTAAEKLGDDTYTARAESWVAALLGNCPDDDWALRYFAAQAYVSLSHVTGDMQFLKQAYETALDNVNELIPKQREMNQTYLSPLVEVDGASGLPWASAEEKEKENYNKMLEAQRHNELAPIYRPLVINLDLLQSIAQEQPSTIADEISITELLGDDASFLVFGLRKRFALASNTDEQILEGIIYNSGEIRIPATCVTTDAAINMQFEAPDGSASINSWTLDRVERGDDKDVNSFTAVYKSEDANKASYVDGSQVTFSINPWPDEELPEITAVFRVTDKKKDILSNAAFWDGKYVFERA